MVAVSPQTGSVAEVRAETAADDDQGRTSEEEDGGADSHYYKQVCSDTRVNRRCVEISVTFKKIPMMKKMFFCAAPC